MRIAYYTHPFLLDCDFPLIHELQDKGHEVLTFISLAPHSLRGSLLDIKKQPQRDDVISASEYPEMLVYANYLNIQNIYFANRIKSSVLTLAYYQLMNRVCGMIEDFNPDVVHLTYPLDTWEMLLFKFRKKCMLVLHDPFPHSGKQNIRSNIARYLSIRFTPKIVLLNQTQKDVFKNKYKVSEKRIFINSLGSYNCILNFAPKHTENNRRNILFFGLISPYKGLENLCKAMIEIHKSHPDVTLIIAGGGHLYFDFTPYKDLDYIELRNHYIGMEELAFLLSHTEFVVCPYKDATQSGVIMTAFAMECPIVASNVGALKEQIEDGKTGLLVPPDDVKALSDAMKNLIENPDALKRMRYNIRQFNLSGKNSWRVIAEKYIEIYKQ